MKNRIHIILVDLDHTIINHEMTRSIVAHELSTRFFKNNKSAEPSAIYMALSKESELLSHIGLSNFRRNWLHPETITSVLAISRRDITPDIYSDWVNLLSGNMQNDEKWLAKFRVNFSKKTMALWADSTMRQKIVDFIKYINSLDNLYTPFDDAVSFLTSVKNAGAIVYIVTEGDRQVQQNKFKLSGLQNLIPFSRFITTDDLCHPPQLTELKTILRIIGNELLINEYLSKHMLNLSMSTTERNIRLREEIQYALDKFPRLNQITILERYYRIISELIHLLSSARLKAHPSFFRFLLHSIWHCPLHPLNGFKVVFANVPLPARELKLATVGDRYDVDIYPLLNSVGSGAVTIRIKQGKYCDTYTDDLLKKLHVPAPEMTFNNLEKAAQYLVDKETWSQVPKLVPPPLLSESMENLRDDLKICLLFPEKSIPYIVARSFLLLGV